MPWLPSVDDVIMVAVVSSEAIEEDRESGMADEVILQEYWCSFDAPLVGSYYSAQMTQAKQDNRIGSFPWEERLPVSTWWDLGIGDYNSIWFTQEIGREIRCIDYEEDNGKSLEDWIKICKEKPFIYGDHFAPHDIDIREYTTGKNRWRSALDLGFRFEIVPKGTLEDGINEVRRELKKVYFNIEGTYNCAKGVESLRQYRKQFDPKLQQYRNKPVHDWASHGADAFRTGIMGRRVPRIDRGPLQTLALADEDDEENYRSYHLNQQAIAL